MATLESQCRRACYASANLCDYYAVGWLLGWRTTGPQYRRDSRRAPTSRQSWARYEPLLLRDRTSVLGIRLVDFDLAIIGILFSMT